MRVTVRVLALVCATAAFVVPPPAVGRSIATPGDRVSCVPNSVGRTVPPRLVAALPPAAQGGVLQTLVRPARWVLSLLTKLLRAVAGILPIAVEDDSMLEVSAGAVAKMRVTSGTATREFPPPDEAYLCFDYRFSPFYAKAPAPELDARAAAPANATVRWLRWADAQPMSDLEYAADLGRLALLRRIRDEAIKIDSAAGRREALPPFLRWMEGEERRSGPRRENLPGLNLPD